MEIYVHFQFFVTTCNKVKRNSEINISFIKSMYVKASGFPDSASDKEPTCQCRRQETWVQSLGWEDPQRRAWQPIPVFFAWRITWIEKPGGLQSMGSQTAGHD